MAAHEPEDAVERQRAEEVLPREGLNREAASCCKQCFNPIPTGARICPKCNSYQDWRSFVPFSTTALALMTALISVLGIAAPVFYKIVHKEKSQATLTMPSVDGTTLRVIAVNKGDAPASIIRAWVDSDYLAPATKVRIRNDTDAIILSGSKLITFDIIPLLDDDDSYRSSMEMLSYILQKKDAPRTEFVSILFNLMVGLRFTQFHWMRAIYSRF